MRSDDGEVELFSDQEYDRPDRGQTRKTASDRTASG